MGETLEERWPRSDDWPRLDRVDGDRETGTVALVLTVTEDCPWMEGHFPERPVLPGVVQLRWAIAAAGLLWPELETVTAVANLKFSAPVLPPATVVLALTRDAPDRKLRFAYRQDDQVRSQGRVTFA